MVLEFDKQLIINAVLFSINIFVLFTFLSYLLFDPVRQTLQKRAEKIKNDLDQASVNKETALKMKQEYEVKIKDIEKEADDILGEARKKALAREADIIKEAKEEANRILERAKLDIEREKDKIKDEVKEEVIMVAGLMTEKLVAASLDSDIQNQLIQDTLNEMGDSTWLN